MKIGLFTTVFIVLFILKLTGELAISWGWVFFPIFIPFFIFILVLMFLFVIALIGLMVDEFY